MLRHSAKNCRQSQQPGFACLSWRSSFCALCSTDLRRLAGQVRWALESDAMCAFYSGLCCTRGSWTGQGRMGTSRRLRVRIICMLIIPGLLRLPTSFAARPEQVRLIVLFDKPRRTASRHHYYHCQCEPLHQGNQVALHAASGPMLSGPMVTMVGLTAIALSQVAAPPS